MSELRESKDGIIYYADSGYCVPVKPKTRTVYSYEERKHNVLPDYTFESCFEAEQKFNHIGEILLNEYGGEFIIEQVSPNNRIAAILPKELRQVQGERQLWGQYSWVDLALFNLSLQSGLTFNFPVQKLRSVFKQDFNIEKDVHGQGNKGFTVDETLGYFSILKTRVSSIFKEQGYEMSNTYFAKMLSVFKMHSAGIIMLDVEEWVKYIVQDADLNMIAFGFSRKLFANKGINFIPAEQVEEYKGLPIEWVERILVKE